MNDAFYSLYGGPLRVEAYWGDMESFRTASPSTHLPLNEEGAVITIKVSAIICGVNHTTTTTTTTTTT